MKKPSIEPKKRIFAQCSLSFHPKIPLKHLYFAVVIKVITYQYGNSLAQKYIYKIACPTQKKGKRRNDTSPMDWMNHIIICLATFYSVYAVL